MGFMTQMENRAFLARVIFRERASAPTGEGTSVSPGRKIFCLHPRGPRLPEFARKGQYVY